MITFTVNANGVVLNNQIKSWITQAQAQSAASIWQKVNDRLKLDQVKADFLKLSNDHDRMSFLMTLTDPNQIEDCQQIWRDRV